jgi:hypothetical protein
MRIKIIKNPSITELLELSNHFNLENPIVHECYKFLMIFYHNDILVGYVNYIESISYVGNIYAYIRTLDSKPEYLDIIIKQMKIKMKKNKYSFAYLDSDKEIFNENVIEILRNNNFEGDDFLFSNL